jgi:pilus assembly protein Flp/PilA
MNHPRLNEVSTRPIDPVACHKQADAPSLRRLWRDDAGQDLIEYALVAALVGLSALAAMRGLKNSVGNTFNGVGNSLTNAVA